MFAEGVAQEEVYHSTDCSRRYSHHHRHHLCGCQVSESSDGTATWRDSHLNEQDRVTNGL